MPKKYIEIEVDEACDGSKSALLEALERGAVIGAPSAVSRATLARLVREVRDDIKSAHGSSLPGAKIDLESLDWPDLASTYNRIVTATEMLDRE